MFGEVSQQAASGSSSRTHRRPTSVCITFRAKVIVLLLLLPCTHAFSLRQEVKAVQLILLTSRNIKPKTLQLLAETDRTDAETQSQQQQ